MEKATSGRTPISRRLTHGGTTWDDSCGGSGKVWETGEGRRFAPPPLQVWSPARLKTRSGSETERILPLFPPLRVAVDRIPVQGISFHSIVDLGRFRLIGSTGLVKNSTIGVRKTHGEKAWSAGRRIPVVVSMAEGVQ